MSVGLVGVQPYRKDQIYLWVLKVFSHTGTNRNT